MTDRTASMAGFNLVSLQQGVSTIGWGCVIGGLTCGPVILSSSGRIGFPSVIGSVVVLYGLSRMPLAGAPPEFLRRRQVVSAAVVLGWLCDIASVFPVVAPITGVVGAVASVLAVVLFLVLMTRLCGWLVATEPARRWRRLNVVVVAAVCVMPFLWAVILAISRLPGASTSPADAGGGVFVYGTGITRFTVTGDALIASAVVGFVALAYYVVAVVFAVQAFAAMKRWTASQHEALAESGSDHVPRHDDVGGASGPRTRTVDGRLVLLVDRAPEPEAKSSQL